MDKLSQLKAWLKAEKRVVVALSGGVDSVLLTYIAKKVLGDDMIAATGESDSVPKRDKIFVVDFCKEHEIRHVFIKTSEFELEEYRRNMEDRCYHCKKDLFRNLSRFAMDNGFNSVLDGTNISDISDLSGHRPGYRAIKEMRCVKNPYIELGITKQEIRGMSKSLGLSVADKPASACLASRIPWSSRIETKDLLLVDRAEDMLRDLGFSLIRVRHHGELARIECAESELGMVIELRKKIDAGLRQLGYKYVTLNLLSYGEQ